MALRYACRFCRAPPARFRRGERLWDLERSLTRPFGHSLGISGAVSVVDLTGVGFLPCFTPNAEASGIGGAFGSFHPKIDDPLLPPPRTTHDH